MPPVGIQKAEELNFSWSIKEFTQTFIELDVIFEKPHMVSSEEDPNKLIIYVWDSTFFTRLKDGVQIAAGTKIEILLKPQVNAADKQQVCRKYAAIGSILAKYSII